MSFSGITPNEYQLPTDVLSALKQRSSIGQICTFISKTPKYQQKGLIANHIASKSYQNLHSISKTENIKNHNDLTYMSNGHNNLNTDNVNGRIIEKHRATLSSPNDPKISAIEFRRSPSLLGSSEDNSVDSSQISLL